MGKEGGKCIYFRTLKPATYNERRKSVHHLASLSLMNACCITGIIELKKRRVCEQKSRQFWIFNHLGRYRRSCTKAQCNCLDTVTKVILTIVGCNFRPWLQLFLLNLLPKPLFTFTCHAQTDPSSTIGIWHLSTLSLVSSSQIVFNVQPL